MEIAACAGTQFDPHVVRAFLDRLTRPHAVRDGPVVLARPRAAPRTPTAHPRLRHACRCSQRRCNLERGRSDHTAARPGHRRRRRPSWPSTSRPPMPASRRSCCALTTARRGSRTVLRRRLPPALPHRRHRRPPASPLSNRPPLRRQPPATARRRARRPGSTSRPSITLRRSRTAVASPCWRTHRRRACCGRPRSTLATPARRLTSQPRPRTRACSRRDPASMGPACCGSRLHTTPTASRIGVVAIDDGGTADGGRDRSAPQTFAVTVLPVDDAPSFARRQRRERQRGRRAAEPRLGDRHLAGPGQRGRPARHLRDHHRQPLTVRDRRTTLDQPDGTLSFAAAPFTSGTARVDVTATDDGGTANGGLDASPTATFTITVTPVNQPPTLHRRPATRPCSRTPARRRFNGPRRSRRRPRRSRLRPSCFDVATTTRRCSASQPAIGPTGVLTYTPAADANGTAHRHRARTGQRRHRQRRRRHDRPTFTITVTPVNDAPSFTPAATSVGARGRRLADARRGRPRSAPARPTRPASTITFTTSNDNAVALHRRRTADGRTTGR